MQVGAGKRRSARTLFMCVVPPLAGIAAPTARNAKRSADEPGMLSRRRAFKTGPRRGRAQHGLEPFYHHVAGWPCARIGRRRCAVRAGFGAGPPGGRQNGPAVPGARRAARKRPGLANQACSRSGPRGMDAARAVRGTGRAMIWFLLAPFVALLVFAGLAIAALAARSEEHT